MPGTPVGLGGAVIVDVGSAPIGCGGDVAVERRQGRRCGRGRARRASPCRGGRRADGRRRRRRPARAGRQARAPRRAAPSEHPAGRCRRRRAHVRLGSRRHRAASVTVACSRAMSPPDAPAIILDCDPGHDDAIAMVVAARHTRILGITTVAGNAPLERDDAQRDRRARPARPRRRRSTPAPNGRSSPSRSTPTTCTARAGSTVRCCRSRPVPPASTDAVGFIIDTCRAHEGTWLVPTGPLTNIALALRAAPDLGGRIAGISLMGGGTFGNRTAVAEFNIWADPDAAAIVFGYGGPLIMSGLDLTHQLQATPERIAAVRALPGPDRRRSSPTCSTSSAARYVSRHHDMRGAAVHDPCAVMALTHPQLFVRAPPTSRSRPTASSPAGRRSSTGATCARCRRRTASCRPGSMRTPRSP